MRTSEEIYHRVRWDPRFDPARFTLGIMVRGAPPKRLPLASFVPGGDIPWHRVLFVEADGEVVWDRTAGVDRLDETSVGRVREPRRLRAPFYTPRPVAGEGIAVPGAGLRVLTWNTLWDRFDSDLIDTARRRPLLLEELTRADADVIALQEVEPALLAMLTMAGYAVSDGSDVAAHGLLLLSRLPVLEAGHHVLSAHKGVAAMVVQTAFGPVAVLATHLTSDHHPLGPTRRADELARLAVGLADIDCPVVLLGDFNGGAVDGLGLVDAWSAVRGDDTPTFDPVSNPLAAVSSLTGQAARLDRVLVRGMRPVAAELLGTGPAAAKRAGAGSAAEWLGTRPAAELVGTGSVFVSDHYGVVADLAPVSVGVLDVASTVRTAVAWLPPSWEAVRRIRAAHDPQVERWPAHVNVLFGFVPESDFAAAAPLLAEAAASTAPFEVRLEEVRTFDHGTAWLDPGAPAEWTSLREALVARFPRCRGRGEGYTPHLTLGRDVGPVRLPALAATVGTLVVLSRRGDEPMRPRLTVELGTGEVRWLPDVPAANPPTPDTADAKARRLAEAPPDTPDMAVRQIADTPPDTAGVTVRRGADAPPDIAGVTVRRVADALPGSADVAVRRSADVLSDIADAIVRRVADALPDGVVHVVGSRRMGCELVGADLDLVAVLPGVGDLARVVVPGAEQVRSVVGARVPGLRFRLDGLAVDLTVVATGDLPPADAVARRGELGLAAVAMSAVSDADAVLAAVAGQHAGLAGRHPGVARRYADFAALARYVKAWAAARGLDSAPHGGLPGLAWTILAARTVRECETDDLRTEFFGRWAAWDWREPITLLGNSMPATGDPMTIMTPSAPVRSCTEQVSAGMRDLITAELYAAWENREAEPPHQRHAAWAVVTAKPVRGEEFDVTLGRLRGRIRALLGFLPSDAQAWPTPFERDNAERSNTERGNTVRYAIGLGANPTTATELAVIGRQWGLPPGVTVAWAGNGEVPTLPR